MLVGLDNVRYLVRHLLRSQCLACLYYGSQEACLIPFWIDALQRITIHVGVPVPSILGGIPGEEPAGARVVVPMPQELQPRVAVLLVAAGTGEPERPPRRARARHQHPKGVVRPRGGRARASVGLLRGRALPVEQVVDVDMRARKRWRERGSRDTPRAGAEPPQNRPDRPDGGNGSPSARRRAGGS